MPLYRRLFPPNAHEFLVMSHTLRGWARLISISLRRAPLLRHIEVALQCPLFSSFNILHPVASLLFPWSFFFLFLCHCRDLTSLLNGFSVIHLILFYFQLYTRYHAGNCSEASQLWFYRVGID